MMLFTAVAIVRERERGNLELLINTPVASGELMIGKVVPYIVIGLIQLALIVAVGALLELGDLVRREGAHADPLGALLPGPARDEDPRCRQLGGGHLTRDLGGGPQRLLASPVRLAERPRVPERQQGDQPEQMQQFGSREAHGRTLRRPCTSSSSSNRRAIAGRAAQR